MSAMRDYITPEQRINVFPIFNVKEKFIIEELNNIFHRRILDDERQNKLEAALHVLKTNVSK
jgi:hypothetical protein